MDIKVGDWITSYTCGIWKVYRVLRIRHEMRFSLSDRRKKSKRIIVFSTRVVDADWKRAFETESCEQTLAHPLTESDRNKLDRALHEEPELLTAFGLYLPKSIDLIVNLSMCVPEVATLQDFCNDTLAPVIAEGKSMEDVLQMLQEGDLDRCIGKFPINATLQMVCRDHEVRHGEFVLRACRILTV